MPAFGGRALPFPLRLGMGLLLASFSLPQLMAGAAGSLLRTPSLAAWLLIAARELLIGATVGLVVSFFFRAAEAAGGLVDVLRGASFAEVLAPDSGQRSSPMGALYLLLATVIFLELGGVGRLSVALARSYEALPLGGGPPGRRRALQAQLAAGARRLGEVDRIGGRPGGAGDRLPVAGRPRARASWGESRRRCRSISRRCRSRRS